MARTLFIPPGPAPVPYSVGRTGPATVPGTRHRETMPRRFDRPAEVAGRALYFKADKAARRERAASAAEHRVAQAPREVRYAPDTHDARLRERVAMLAGVAAANAIAHVHPGDLPAVIAAAASGRLEDKARRALKRAIDRAARG